MSASAAENRLRRWFTGDVHTKIQFILQKQWRGKICSAVFVNLCYNSVTEIISEYYSTADSRSRSCSETGML